MTDYELIPVNNTQLENVIIGSLLIDRNVSDIVFSNLIPDDFYLPANNLIFNSCLRLYTNGKPIDMVTVIQDMKENKEPDYISHIMQTTKNVVSTANIDFHIQYLKQISIKRQLASLGQKIISESIRYEIPTIDQITDVTNIVSELQNRIVQKRVMTFKDVVIQTIDESLSNKGKDTIGLRSGFEKLDNITSGFSAPDFTIIAGGPGEGKSTFALNIAKYMSLRGNDVLFYSLEMKERQLILKLLSDVLSKSVTDIRLGHFDGLEALKSTLLTAKLHIYDKGGITIDELVNITKLEVKTKGVKIVFIDYLQLIRLGAYYRKVSNKNDEVTIISNRLKQLAMELNIPVVALSQLNRDKTRKRYTKADLRDSGALEQDADNIFFIFRPTEHDMFTYNLGNETIECDESTVIINIDKYRLGNTGEFRMVFNGTCSRFEDYNYRKENVSYVDSFPRIDTKEDLPF